MVWSLNKDVLTLLRFWIKCFNASDSLKWVLTCYYFFITYLCPVWHQIVRVFRAVIFTFIVVWVRSPFRFLCGPVISRTGHKRDLVKKKSQNKIGQREATFRWNKIKYVCHSFFESDKKYVRIWKIIRNVYRFLYL